MSLSRASSSLESFRGSSALSTGSNRSYSPPFGLDDDAMTDISDFSRSTASRGYRNGGPKEARLRRVAFLSMVKDVDQLHPVIIENIPETVNEQKLSKTLSSYGEIGDIYIPVKFANGKPASNFAVVRYKSPDAKEKALNSSSSQIKIDGKEVAVSPMRKQTSFFTKGTGYHGICNLPVEDGTYDRRPVTVQQEITLASCRSRSGYPWGSVRELKYLPPHLTPEAQNSFPVRLENLPRHVNEEDIREKFERFGKITDVHCPKPIIVTQQVKDANIGHAFVRFEDVRDRDAAVKAYNGGEITFGEPTVKAKPLVPSFWPTEKTRRFY